MKNKNPINESGKLSEKSLETFLKVNNIPFKSGGNTTIDFTIFMENRNVYVDCTNQNVPGSVMEKLPHKIWKYHNRIGFDEVIILRGIEKIGREVMEHIRYLERELNISVNILTQKEFENYILERPTKTQTFFDFKTNII